MIEGKSKGERGLGVVRLLWIAGLGIGLANLSACGLLLGQTAGNDAHGFPVTGRDDEPPHAVLIEGEIRDFRTFRPEPGAVIETWTEDPEYRPTAKVDDRAQYALRFDVCRKEADAGQQMAAGILAPGPHGCMRWASFRFRARLGDRCSVVYREENLPKGRGPLILWLRPCDEVESAWNRRSGAP